MRVLVLGAARSGLAASRLAMRLGHRVSVYDANPERAGDVIEEGLAALVGAWDPGYLEGVDLVLASPGFPERSTPITDAYERAVTVESEFEFGWRHLDADTIIAVTGTNGKTTVTDLIATMLDRSGFTAAAMGNIGSAVSEHAGFSIERAVIEVSSAQLQLAHVFRPDIAVITNVTEDHLDWHGSVHAYRLAKVGVVARQEAEDLVVFNAEDPGACEVAAKSAGRPRPVGTDGVRDGFGVSGPNVVLGGVEVGRERFQISDGPFMTDILLAGAAATEAGAAIDSVIGVAVEFEPADHRQRFVTAIDGVRFVNDSKATNPHAALASISVHPSVVLIAGGQAKGLEITDLVRHPNVRAALVIGESAPLLRDTAPDLVTVVDSMEEAVEAAWHMARPGDVVLLAPGGASWDMFSSYAERGDRFAQAALRIEGRR